MKKRIVITGLGILTSNAKGRQEYWQAMEEARVGYKPVTLFDASQFNVNIAGEISDFDPKIYMGQKGLRTLDRSTTMIVSSAKLAVQDCGFEITEENTNDVGVSVGTTLGSVKSIAEFDEVTLKEGPRYTNPALFPNTVINSPASQISIWCKIKGFNTTISTGFTASMDAMNYAYDFLQYGRAHLIFTGGVEEMCFHTFYGFYALRFMSGSKDGESFINCPFDKRRNGVTFGEGACMMAMEEYDHAKARGANMLGEVLGFGSSFDPFRINKYNPRAAGLIRSMNFALQDAELKPEDIDCIYANANSTIMADKMETHAIKEVFGQYAYQIPITATKSLLGECYSVSAAFATSAALGTLNKDFIPPTINLLERDPDCDLDYVPLKTRYTKVNNIMVISAGPNGSNTCVILSRPR